MKPGLRKDFQPKIARIGEVIYKIKKDTLLPRDFGIIRDFYAETQNKEAKE